MNYNIKWDSISKRMSRSGILGRLLNKNLKKNYFVPQLTMYAHSYTNRASNSDSF